MHGVGYSVYLIGTHKHFSHVPYPNNNYCVYCLCSLQENFITMATVATPNTGRSPTHHLRTSTPSPLSVVQPRGSTRRTRSISLSPISNSSSSLHTPQSTSTHLVDNVKRLSISGSDNGDNDIRRCLFPEISPSSTPLTQHVSQDSWFFERDALVGKRMNRARLKRL